MMSKLTLAALLTLALPTLVLVVGSWVMSQVSGRGLPKPSATVKPADLKPLGMRPGYDVGGVSRHWGAFDDDGLRAEKRFLQLDLAFPLFFGAALAFSLVLAWDLAGRPFNPAWLLAPVLLGVLADWAENLAQLNQIGGYLASGAEGLRENVVRVASTATVLKWLFFIGAWVVLLSLIVVSFARPVRSS